MRKGNSGEDGVGLGVCDDSVLADPMPWRHHSARSRNRPDTTPARGEPEMLYGRWLRAVLLPAGIVCLNLLASSCGPMLAMGYFPDTQGGAKSSEYRDTSLLRLPNQVARHWGLQVGAALPEVDQHSVPDIVVETATDWDRNSPVQCIQSVRCLQMQSRRGTSSIPPASSPPMTVSCRAGVLGIQLPFSPSIGNGSSFNGRTTTRSI